MLFQVRFPSVGRVCNFLGSFLPQQRFETADQCYSSVTAQFYSTSKGSTPSRYEGGLIPKERLSLGSSFYIFCLLPPSLPCVTWASQEGCLFYLSFSFQSSDFLLFHLHELFPFSFSHHHFGLLFPILTT